MRSSGAPVNSICCAMRSTRCTKDAVRCCRSSVTRAWARAVCCAKRSHRNRKIESYHCAQNRTARNAPFRLARDPLRRLLAIDAHDHGDAAAALLERVLETDRAQLPWLSLVGEALQIDIEPSAEVAALQPGFRAERRGAVLAALIAARHRHPLVFVVDDAQWADEASSELLSSIARGCRDHGWLMLVSRRNVDMGFRPGPDIELPIGPMPRTTSAGSSCWPPKRRRCARTMSMK